MQLVFLFYLKIRSIYLKMWIIIYMSVLGILTIFIPSAIFYYETDFDKTLFERICESIIGEFLVIVFCGLLIFISFYFGNTTSLPIIYIGKS